MKPPLSISPSPRENWEPCEMQSTSEDRPANGAGYETAQSRGR